jgi:hypothetical protein
MAGRILYYGNIIREGLILFLDGPKKASYPGSGNSLTDFSDSGNNSTLVNGVGFNVNAFTFDGVNDYILVSPSSELASIQVPMTIMGWYYDDGTKTTPTVFSQYLNTTPGNLVKLVRVQSGVLTYFSSKSVAPGYGVFQLTGTTSQYNTWNFFAVTVDGTLASHTVTLTLNTTSLTFSGTSMASPNTSVEIRVGSAQSSFLPSNEFFSGRISNVLLYNRGLTSAEITQNYNATKGRYI